MTVEYLFVYGTLRKGAYSPMDRLLERHCEFLTDAHFQGVLYDVAGYPGVTESSNSANKVYGEIYTVQRARQLWPSLDHYEHCSKAYTKPYEYVRKKRTILIENDEPMQAWVYLFNWKAGGLRKIESGDYLSYLNAYR